MPGFGPGGGALAPETHRPRLRLARSLLATPWFAAGAGIVIAAVLAVDTPTALTYGPTDPGEQCPVHGCGSASSPGQPATAAPGAPLKAPGMQLKGGGTAAARQSGRAAGDVRLGYQIVRQGRSGFVSVITLPDAARARAWSLHFTFRSARVDHVWGAHWHPSATREGGTADGPAGRAGPARPVGGFPGDQSGADQPGGYEPGAGRPGAGQLMMSATGRPQSPSGCRLDGIKCRFG